MNAAIAWGEYLCRGVFAVKNRSIYSIRVGGVGGVNEADMGSIAYKYGPNVDFATHCKEHGWALLEIDAVEAAESVCVAMGKDGDKEAISVIAQMLLQWELILKRAFDSVSRTREYNETEEKENVNNNEYNTYRNMKGLPVGHRVDGARHFFESRILTQCIPHEQVLGQPAVAVPKARLCPSYMHTDAGAYDALALVLFWLMSRSAGTVLRSLLGHIGWDARSVEELCDVGDAEHLDRIVIAAKALIFPRSMEGDKGDPACAVGVVNNDDTVDVSSSLLRVCCYPNAPVTSMAFGAHTDTTMLTMGPISSSPGLELYDRPGQSWVNVEAECAMSRLARSRPVSAEVCSVGKITVGLFIGEILQVLTRKYYLATIHRVRAPQGGVHVKRYSCPLLVRGKWGRRIRLGGTDGEDNPIDGAPVHPGGAAVADMLPDLDGIDMKTLHRILDHKRAKCRVSHESRVRTAKRNDINRLHHAAFNVTDKEEDEDNRWDPNWVLASDAETTVIR